MSFSKITQRLRNHGKDCETSCFSYDSLKVDKKKIPILESIRWAREYTRHQISRARDEHRNVEVLRTPAGPIGRRPFGPRDCVLRAPPSSARVRSRSGRPTVGHIGDVRDQKPHCGRLCTISQTLATTHLKKKKHFAFIGEKQQQTFNVTKLLEECGDSELPPRFWHRQTPLNSSLATHVISSQHNWRRQSEANSGSEYKSPERAPPKHLNIFQYSRVGPNSEQSSQLVNLANAAGGALDT